MKIETKYPGYVCIFKFDHTTFLNTYEQKFIKVADNLSFNDLEIININTSLIATKYKVGEFEVLASNGKSYYNIISDGINISCNCTGFGFRKKCKHIEKFMFENKIS